MKSFDALKMVFYVPAALLLIYLVRYDLQNAFRYQSDPAKQTCAS